MSTDGFLNVLISCWETAWGGMLNDRDLALSVALALFGLGLCGNVFAQILGRRGRGVVVVTLAAWLPAALFFGVWALSRINLNASGLGVEPQTADLALAAVGGLVGYILARLMLGKGGWRVFFIVLLTYAFTSGGLILAKGALLTVGQAEELLNPPPEETPEG